MKCAKPQYFQEFFNQNIFDNFSREIKIVNSKIVQNRNIFTIFSPKNPKKKSPKNQVEFLDKKVLNSVSFWR